jgi:hypothetical protein
MKGGKGGSGSKNKGEAKTTSAPPPEDELHLPFKERMKWKLLYYLTDNDWVTAAKVVPREEFLSRVVSFYQNYGVISALVLTLSVSSFWYVPIYQGKAQYEFWISLYCVCIWLASSFTLLSLLSSLLALNNTQKIPADYSEMLWFADAAMPYLNSLIIVPFKLGLFFFVTGIAIYALLTYSQYFLSHPYFMVFFAITPVMFLIFWSFSRWFNQQVALRLEVYATALERVSSRYQRKKR